MMQWKERTWLWLGRHLPRRLVYQCGIQMWSETTVGKYGSTVVGDLTMSEAISRYGRIHAIPGHGADLHYNSNR